MALGYQTPESTRCCWYPRIFLKDECQTSISFFPHSRLYCKGLDMEVTFIVAVDSIVKNGTRTTVSASNGGNGGPPSLTWQLPYIDVEKCHIGKRYEVSINEA